MDVIRGFDDRQPWLTHLVVHYLLIGARRAREEGDWNGANTLLVEVRRLTAWLQRSGFAPLGPPGPW